MMQKKKKTYPLKVMEVLQEGFHLLPFRGRVLVKDTVDWVPSRNGSTKISGVNGTLPFTCMRASVRMCDYVRYALGWNLVLLSKKKVRYALKKLLGLSMLASCSILGRREHKIFCYYYQITDF